MAVQDTHQGFPSLALLEAPEGEWPTSELRPVELPQQARPKGYFASYCATSIDGLLERTTGRLRYVWLAAFSLCHRRDGRAGTTILQLVSHPTTTGPRHFPSDNGPDGLLEQGQRRRIRRSSRTVLRDYWPKKAASSSRRAVGTAGPFQGPRADWEQRTPPSTPPGPQYHSRDYGPGWIRQTAMPEYTAASGRHDHATFWERADESVRCSGFWSKASTRRLTDRARAG